jgi:hypothetical protein
VDSTTSVLGSFPDAYRFPVNGEQKAFTCTVQVSGMLRRALDAPALDRHLEEERGRAAGDLYRAVARETGVAEQALRGQTAVRFVDKSDVLVAGILELGALVAREATA